MIGFRRRWRSLSSTGGALGAIALSAIALGWLPGVGQAAGGSLSFLTAVACPASTQCTAVGKQLVFTFDPATPGEPAATVVTGKGFLTGVACPSLDQCTAIDSGGQEITFDPASPGDPTPVAVDRAILTAVACPTTAQCTAVDDAGLEVTFNPTAPGGRGGRVPIPVDQGRTPGTSEQDRLDAVACPSSTQCTAVDDAGLEVTFNPTAPGAPGALVPILIDPAGVGSPLQSLAGVGCPSTGQCTAVDAGGREVTFDPAAPGTPSPATIYMSGLPSANPLTAASNTLSAIACPSVTQCTAVGYEREFTFDPTAPDSPKPTTIDAEDNSGVACATASLCTAVNSTGQEVTFDPAAPLLPNPIRIDGVATLPRANVSAGRASVRLTCGSSAAGPCRIALRLLARRAGRAVTLARRTVAVPAGHSKIVELALDASGRRLLSAEHKLSVTLSVTQRESAELRWTIEQTLVFDAPARHRRRAPARHHRQARARRRH